MPVVIMELSPGESINTQAGAMSWKTASVKMNTNSGGGLGKMVSRKLSGESLMQNTYTAVGKAGILACASKLPGAIIPIQISPERSIIAQKRAYLAAEPSVEMKMFFQKKIGTALFGGEGFIMQRFSGRGMVFLEIDGSVVQYDLDPGETLDIDNGYLAAMDDTVRFEIKTISGVKNVLFGGEGLFNVQVTGPGHVWLQTMPVEQMASALIPYFPSKG